MTGAVMCGGGVGVPQDDHPPPHIPPSSVRHVQPSGAGGGASRVYGAASSAGAAVDVSVVGTGPAVISGAVAAEIYRHVDTACRDWTDKNLPPALKAANNSYWHEDGAKMMSGLVEKHVLKPIPTKALKTWGKQLQDMAADKLSPTVSTVGKSMTSAAAVRSYV